MDEGARKLKPHRRHHQSRLADGPRQGGAQGPLHRRGGRSLAEAPPDRRDRPLSRPLARHGDAARRDARGVPAPDREGQDPVVRRLEPHCRTARGGNLGRQGARRRRATKSCSPNTISPTEKGSNPASPTSASARRSASSPISASPRASCRASTAAKRTSPRARAAAGSRTISIRAGFAFSTRSTRSPLSTRPSRPKSRSPG